jgi:hypothetical protein
VKKSAPWLLVGCGVLCLWAHGGQEKRGLPGARAAVQAADHPTLQAAIDALPAEGGLVVLPPGTFEISAPLRITKGDVLLRGAGTATHLKNAGTDGAAAILIGPADYDADRRARIWRVALSDLRLTGNEQSGHGNHARGVNEIHIHGVTVSHHGGDGIRLENCYEDPRVADSLITYNRKTGLHIEAGHDIVVCGNQFEENMDALRCVDSFNLTMTGNNLDDHLGHGVVIENTYGSVLSGNMIEECKGTAIVLDRDCYGITLSANVIAHDGGGIDLRDAHGCAVSANTFVLVKENALRIGPSSGRIAVSGNSFCDSHIGGAGLKKRKVDDQASAGLVLEGTSDVAVSGNQFSGLSTRAVALPGEPSRRVLFAGNVLTEVESDHATLSGQAGSLVADNLEAPKRP